MLLLLACASRPAVTPAATVDTPFLDQNADPSFEEPGDGGGARGWSPVPGDAKGWALDDTLHTAGGRSVRITESLWYCTDWEPVAGLIRISGNVRGQDITDDKNRRHGAAVSLRLRGVDGAAAYPVLQGWSGTFDWQAFHVGFDPPHEATDYRACVGMNGTPGTAWFDDVHAGSADLPPLLPIAVDGTFEGAAPTGWVPHMAEPGAFVMDPDTPHGGARSLRVDAPGLLCTPWQAHVAQIGVKGQARTASAAPGVRDWQGLVVQGRTRATEGGPEALWPLLTFGESPAWAPFEEDWAVPDGAESRICVGRSGGSGTLWLDDVEAWAREPAAPPSAGSEREGSG